MAVPPSLRFLLLRRGVAVKITWRSCSAASARKSTAAVKPEILLSHSSLLVGRTSRQELRNVNPGLVIRMKEEASGDDVEKHYLGANNGNDEIMQEEEIPAQNFFLDPTPWWDIRQHGQSHLCPGSSHKGPKDGPRMDNRYQPAWAYSQRANDPLGFWRTRPTLSASTLTSEHVRKLLFADDAVLSEAVDVLDLLVRRGCYVGTSLFHRILKRCTADKDFLLGKRVHALALKSGYQSNAFLANHIIGFYASHGMLEEAYEVFTKVAVPNAFMWASIILAHARHGQPREAIDLYRTMRDSSVNPDNHVYVAVLKACTKAGDSTSGKEVHADILGSAVEPDLFVFNCLVNMYAKCGSIVDARKVFNALPKKDTVTWTAMITGYVQHGLEKEALSLYASMQHDTPLTPSDSVMFLALLQACASSRNLHHGKELHLQIQHMGLEADLAVGNCLVNMYAKCGSLEDARRVFDRLPRKGVATWNAMIAGYAQWGFGQEALALYGSMQHEGMTPADHISFVSLLQACASIGALQQGKDLHAQIKQRGLESDVVVGSCLVDMYCKSGALDDARRVFDTLPKRNVVTWTAMIAGYAQHGLGKEALALYSNMQDEGIIPADHVMFASLLQACAVDRSLHQGKELHEQIKQRGLEADVVVGNCLVDMYSKCGSLDDARTVFDRLSTRTVATWTAMISGYAKNELGHEALALYARMQQEGITPADHVMFGCLLQACASVGALHQGKQLHAQILERGMEADLFVGNCLVDMYAKCGSLEDACTLLSRLTSRDVMTWTALLNGYAREGKGRMAMWCFKEMQRQGIQPDDATFICLLVACSHEGMVQEGQQFFRMMVEQGIVPTAYHYTCIVDILGRSGCLDEAENMLQTVPLESSVVGWTSLLNSCKSHGDVERGRRCFDRLTEMEPGNAGAYVLLGNIYANAGRWADVYHVERLRKAAGAKKKPAKACIEVENKVHEFTVGEEMSDISSKLRSVNWRLKEEGGHVPQTELVLKAVSEREKEDALCGHAEKLALAYGILNTPEGTPLLVTKNLRMCNDCHSGTKIMSRLERREIIVRDAHRLHRFVDGSCSCGDRH